MGRKLRGAALRAKKRAQSAVNELQEQQAEVAATQNVTSIADDQLFVVDTKGDKSVHVPRSLKKGDGDGSKKRRKDLSMSDKDKAQVERLLKKHSAEKLAALAAKGRKVMEPQNRHRRKRLAGTTKAKFDLWGTEDDGIKGKGNTLKKKAAEEEEVESSKEPTPPTSSVNPGIGSTLAGIAPSHHVPIKAKAVSQRGANSKPDQKGIAVDVAKPGQSYHPDPIAYEKVVEKAVDVELRRNSAIENKEKPLSRGLSKETRELLVASSDSESDSDDFDEDESDDDHDDGGTKNKKVQKRTEKLTRAQRNKQKRLRKEKAEIERGKKLKKQMNRVGEIGRFKKELKQEGKERLERKERIAKAKLDQRRLPGKDVDQHVSKQSPIDAPTVPVALSYEMKSSLRSLKPKGSLVSDRISSLIDRKLAPTNSSSKRKDDGSGRKRRTKKRRKLSVKGKKNNEGVGPDFVVLG